MKKESFILFMLLNIFTVSSAQDYHLQLHIEGMQYDSLTLKGERIGDNGDFTVFINGKTLDSTNWNFVIPDSIYHSVVCFLLGSKPKNADINTNYEIYFNTIQNRDTLRGGGIYFSQEIKKIDMMYWKSETYKDMLFRRPIAERTGSDEDVYTADLHIDYFLIPYFSDTDFSLQFTQSLFGVFYSVEGDSVIDNKYTYDEYISQYLKIIEKYPNSRFLISQIANHLQPYYKTKEDLQKLYNAFSEANRQTGWGKVISNYINNFYTFSDTILPTWDTGTLESIIQDSTKINMVIFSASWCAPCREEIPLLKQIYNDLKEYVNITYISEDEQKSVDNWKKLMQQEDIPWRSLLAVNDAANIKKKYYVEGMGVPCILLVYPNKRVEVIDVRVKEDKDKLYSLCGK